MKKGDYKKTTNSKEQWIKSDLAAKKWICLSTEWKRWAKRYLTRSYRRRTKLLAKKGDNGE